MSSRVSTARTAEGRSPSRGPVLLAVACVALYATGLVSRPSGAGWDHLYDVVLFNAAYLPAAVACWLAGRRVPEERTAWWALALALSLFAPANALRTLAAGLTGAGGPPPVLGNALAVVGYVLIYVTMVVLIRARVPRFHPSMWLDGVIGALGTIAVGIAFLIGPYVSGGSRHGELRMMDLTWPVGDVLLLALLVAVGSILGVRLDRALVALTGALGCVFAGDVQLFVRCVAGTYDDGGPLDLSWLLGIILVAVAAHLSRRRATPAAERAGSRLGWRLLAVPLACTIASLVVLAIGWGDQLP